MAAIDLKLYLEHDGKEYQFTVRRFKFGDEPAYYELIARSGTRQVAKVFGKWTVKVGNPVPYELLKKIGREIEAAETDLHNKANKAGDFYPDQFPDE